MTITLNGKISRMMPGEPIAVNGRSPTRLPLDINGQAAGGIAINGYRRPPVLPDCVLNLPLWHSKLSNPSVIYSMDKYAHLCTNTGALWTPEGLLYDGVDDCTNCGNNAALNILSDMTIELWAYPTAAARRWFAKGPTDGDVREFGLFTAESSRWYPNGTASMVLLYQFPSSVLNAWGHFVLTHDSSNQVSLYWNGNAVSDNVAGSAMSNNSDSLVIGRGGRPAAATFKGKIGEFQVYDRLLTTAEIQNKFMNNRRRYR